MKVNGLVEVVLYAREMQAQVEFYRDVMGLRVTYPEGVEDYRHENWVTFDTGGCVLALHSGGARRIGEGMPRIVFGVDDIQAAREYLQQKGVRLGIPRQAPSGQWICDGDDPEGNPLSIESRA